MPTLLPCGSVSSPLIQKWKENIRTPEVLLKQRCSTSIKTRKEKKLLFLKLKFHFLTNSQLLVKCRGPLWAAPALRQLEVVQTVCTWPEVLDFHCSFRFQHYGDWERLEVMISWHRDCFSPSCCSPFFHFFSLPFCLPLVERVDWHFSLYWENSLFAMSKRGGREQGYK